MLLITKVDKERTQLTEYIKTLYNKLKDLQHCSCTACIEIRNIPAKVRESYDDLVTIIVTKIGSAISKQLVSLHLRGVRRIQVRQRQLSQLLLNSH